MRAKTIFMILIFISLFSLHSHAAEKAPVLGIYDEIPGHEFKFDGKQVEIIEFLSFYCGHCYQFEKSIPVIKGNFPKKIKWKTIPLYWGKGSPKPGEAYLLAEEAGKGEQMKKALFEAFFVEKREIGSIDVLEDIGVRIGLGFDFSQKLRNGEKAREAGEAILKANKYDIKETPTMIIAGNLKVTPRMLGNPTAFRDNIITILKSIFESKQ